MEVAHTLPYILLINSDVQISVWSALLMPSAQSMEHLMHDGPLVLTPATDGYVLGASNPTNI